MPTAESPDERCHKATAIVAATLLLLLQACAAPPPPGERPAPAPEAPAPPAAVEVPALNGRLLADAQEYPWSAIGRVNLAGRGFCNGILIGPSEVLTQARCLYNGPDGRWYQPQELHFIAAYQKDSFLADSPIADFTVSPGFNPDASASLTNLTENWAVVVLREPIGRATGWLGVQWDNAALKATAETGAAAYLRAGYRRDWPHAISLYFGCGEAENGLASTCSATPSELALPAFVLDGELRVLGNYFLRPPAQGDTFTRVTAARLSGDQLGSAAPPSAAGPVGRKPTGTASRLLEALGYPVIGGDIAAAAAAFRRDQGLPAEGQVDIALLTALLNAAQRSGGN